MPTFRERLKLAGAALSPYSPAPGSQAALILGGVLAPGRGEPPLRNTTSRLQAYSDMPWLRAIGEKIASDVAAVQWELFLPRNAKNQPVGNRALQRAGYANRKKAIASRRKDVAGNRSADLEPVETHPFLDMVMDKGNAVLPGAMIRKLTQLYLDLTGEAFLVKERDALGTVIALWPVPPDWVIGTPTPYRPFYLVVYRGWRQDIRAEDVLALTNPNPVNPYARGSGIVAAIGDELDTDEYAAKFTKQFFFNDATPPFMVFPKNTGGESAAMGEPEVRRLESSWLNKFQGMFRQHRPVFSSRELGIYEFTKDLKKMQLVDLRKNQRDIIMQVFGMPPEILGVLEHSNRSTIASAEYLYATHVLVPRLEFQRTFYQERLIPEYDPRFILDYVTPVQEDRIYQLDVIKAAPWAFTADEIRKRAGEPELDDSLGDVHAVPINVTLQPDLTPPPAITLPENPSRTPAPSTGTPTSQAPPQKGLEAQPIPLAVSVAAMASGMGKLAEKLAQPQDPPQHHHHITVTPSIVPAPQVVVHQDASAIAITVPEPSVIIQPAPVVRTQRVERDAEGRIIAFTSEAE